MINTKEQIVFEWTKPTEGWEYHAPCGCIVSLYQYDGDAPNSLALGIDPCYGEEADYIESYDDYSARTEKRILEDAVDQVYVWFLDHDDEKAEAAKRDRNNRSGNPQENI